MYCNSARARRVRYWIPWHLEVHITPVMVVMATTRSHYGGGPLVVVVTTVNVVVLMVTCATAVSSVRGREGRAWSRSLASPSWARARRRCPATRRAGGVGQAQSMPWT